MAAFFKRDNNPEPEPIMDGIALQKLLKQAETEKKVLGGLIESAGSAVKEIVAVQESLEEAGERTRDLSARLADLEKIGEGVSEMSGKIGDLETRLAELQTSNQGAASTANELGREIAQLKTSTAGVSESLGAARQLKADIDALGGAGGAVGELSAKIEELRRRFLEYNHDVNQVRDDQVNLKRIQDEVRAQLEEMRNATTSFKDEVRESAETVARLEVGMGELRKVQEISGTLDRDLRSLKVLSDQVLQKTRAVEQQHEIVERAERQAAKLDELVWELDKRIKHVSEENKRIKKTQERLTDLKAMNEAIREETRRTQESQKEAAEWAENALQEIIAVREHIGRSVEQARSDARGLDSMSKRVVDLRSQINDFEKKFGEFERSGQLLSEARTRADEMAARLNTFTSELDRVSEQVDRVRVVQIALERTESSAARLEARMSGLDELKGRVEEINQTVGRLGAVRDEVREATERFQSVRSELEVARTEHSETRARVAEMTSSIETLREEMSGVEQQSVRVERVREDAERALGAMRDFEAREEFLRQLESRMGTLGTTGETINEKMRVLEERRSELAEIDKRVASLGERLDDADRRFETVGRRAEEIMRADERISEVVDRAREAGERLDSVGSGVETALAREDSLNAIASRIEEMASEFELREKALQTATEHLEQATTLRKSAAQTATDLEEQGRKLAASLAAGEEQADRVADLAERIESRAESLRFAEKRFTQFEEKLASLKRAEDEIVGHIEGVLARQESVEAVRDELARAFSTAENTLQDVRLIGDARHEISTARAAMEEVLSQAHQLDETSARLEGRKADIDAAEERMAHLDALLSEVRTSLGTLRSQQAVLEHLVEKGGQLAFQVKEAEALIVALKEERELASRVHDALNDVRDDDARPMAG